MPTATESRWILRPTWTEGVRHFSPVAIVDGVEVVSGPFVGRLETVAAARAWITRCYDGGRAFPKAPSHRINTTTIDGIRERIRFAGV